MIASKRTAPLAGVGGRALRLGWTALSFALFGIGAVLFGALFFPLLYLAVRDPARRERVARRTVSALFGAFIRFMAVFVLSYRVTGLDAARAMAPAVIVANHPTLIDAVFLLWLFPGADCVVKADHWVNPFMMFAVRAARYIPNRDNEELLATAVARVRAGGRLLVFPEGTRTPPGVEPVFRRGAAVIAARAGADIVPVRIACTPPALRKGEPWWSIPPRRGHFEIEVLPAMGMADAAGDAEKTLTLERTARLKSLLCAQ